MKIVGLCVIGKGEADRYLKHTLDTFKRLTDDVVIALNDTDEKTENMVKEYGFWAYRDDREWGKYQPQIKTDLLKKVAKLKPDWVLPLDSDEIFDSSITRERLEGLTHKSRSCYFYVTNLWNDENHYSQDLSFWNIRFFRFLPELGLEYLHKPLHCGLAPPWAYHMGNYVPHLLIHYGLMKREDRMRKVQRYNQYDPNAKYKGREYYDALESDAAGSEFVEKEVLEKVQREVARYKEQKVYA